MKLKAAAAIVASLALTACASKHDRDTDPMHWGSFKCAAVGDGKTYTGWSTDEINAKRNAMALCHEHARSCQFKSCQDETVAG